MNNNDNLIFRIILIILIIAILIVSCIIILHKDINQIKFQINLNEIINRDSN